MTFVSIRSKLSQLLHYRNHLQNISQIIFRIYEIIYDGMNLFKRLNLIIKISQNILIIRLEYG